MNSLVFLRRMILNQKPSRIDYQVGDLTKTMYYDRAGFTGTSTEVIEALREIFQSDQVSVSNETINPAITTRIFAPLAISSALNGYKFNAETRAVLLSFTMRLPPLMVRLFPLQRYSFQDNSSYRKMHMQYELAGVFRMQHYISQAENSLDEVVRLRVMIATYVLGLIAPLEKSKSHNDTQRVRQQHSGRKKKVGLLSRIINRIRGL